MCISPTAIVVLPTPELVPATTMVGTLAVGSAVRTRIASKYKRREARVEVRGECARRAPTERAKVWFLPWTAVREASQKEGKEDLIYILETEY